MVVKSQLHLTLLTTGHLSSDAGFDFSLHYCQLPSPSVHSFKLSPLKPCSLQEVPYSVQKIMGNAALRSRIRLRYVEENSHCFTRG